MKKVLKHTKIVTSLLLLVLAFFGVVNVTFAYFSSSDSASGTHTFDTLDVEFMYDNGTTIQSVTTNTLELVSISGPIQRGVTFNLGVKPEKDGDNPVAVEDIIIRTKEKSCDCYIRFWIDAYIVNSDQTLGTVNYGKYFVLPENYAIANQGSSASGSWCYYAINIQGAESELGIGNALTLQDLNVGEENEDLVPVNLLGEKLKITISFEAVQEANNAFSHVFNDEKGYFTGYYDSEDNYISGWGE